MINVETDAGEARQNLRRPRYVAIFAGLLLLTTFGCRTVPCNNPPPCFGSTIYMPLEASLATQPLSDKWRRDGFTGALYVLTLKNVSGETQNILRYAHNGGWQVARLVTSDGRCLYQPKMALEVSRRFVVQLKPGDQMSFLLATNKEVMNCCDQKNVELHGKLNLCAIYYIYFDENFLDKNQRKYMQDYVISQDVFEGVAVSNWVTVDYDP